MTLTMTRPTDQPSTSAPTDSTPAAAPLATRRVVVTGTGVICPIGGSTEEFWQSLLDGRSNFTGSSVDGVGLVATVPDGWDSMFSAGTRRYTDRCTRFALRAAREALTNAGIVGESEILADAGIFVGSSIGGVGTLAYEFNESALHGLDHMSPLGVPKALTNMIAANLSIQLGIRGEALTYSSACASGAVAIGEAYRRIRSGDLDVALAGGAEACVIDQVLESFRKLGAMSSSDDADAASTPFSKDRSGFVMSEGAGMIVLESLEHATARGANILGEMVGYHGASDGKSLLAPNLDGILRAVSGLFSRSRRFVPENVGYINAHGTSTVLNDKMESAAIAQLFPHRPLVSSTKSYYGHPFGAAGALEAIVCLLSLKRRIAIPTLNVSEADVDPMEIDINLLLGEPVAMPEGLALSISLAFGGQNAALLFSR